LELLPDGVVSERLPDDVLIVEDDPIIALGFEDTISGFRQSGGMRSPRSNRRYFSAVQAS